MQNIYPNTFEEKIGFKSIQNQVVALCLCPMGKRKAEEVSFYTDFKVISRLIHQTNEMKTICQMEDSFPVDGYADTTPFLNRIKHDGTWLDEAEVFTLRRSLDAIKAVVRFLKKGEKPQYPYLADLATGVDYFPFVADRIDAILNRFGKIKDNASSELARIRSEIASKQTSVSKRIGSILKAAQAEGLVDDDATTSMREGRIVIPVSASNKRKLKGIIHDESATGKTVFIEPVEVVELNNEIRELEYDERREIVKILVEFADSIRPYLPELLKAYDFLGDIDFIRAKGLFAVSVVGAMPILQAEPKIYLRKAVHPLLLQALKREGKQVVPLDIELDKNNRILLISGPNAGGKSVCLKTLGVSQYMLQCGFLPPVLENSEMGIFSKLFIDIGDEQSIENDLSTYSSHLLNMKFFIKYANEQTLVLIDEFGAGTEPIAGGAIAEAILQQLTQLGTFGVITTHYSNLKHFAANTQGVINGAMLFDMGKIEPLFKLEIGKPGSSFAFEIARKIGVPEEVLKLAEAKTGTDHITFEKHLKEISRDKRYWERKRDQIRISSKKTEEYENQLAEELETIKSKRKEILKKAKDEAEAVLAKSNKIIENTIREIKESDADRVRTQKARATLEEQKKIIAEQEPEFDSTLENRMEQIRLRQKRNEERKTKKGEPKLTPDAVPEISKQIAPGEKVRIIGQDSVGEVMQIDKKSAMVAFGSMLTSIKVNRLERVSLNEYRRAERIVRSPQTGMGFDLNKKRLNFRSDIDVRGYRADAALEEVQDLIDEAAMIGIHRVRVLHGKGNGILRQEIRSFLKTMPFVKTFADEHVEFGGAGITVVELDF
ncbi:MAG: Smr/MutS family protein [Bacteroidales bacterium]|jgi:DNA mismatch repair protein MutS2|nr:Smr/MutS family protein [Bacteroidales bacterium]MDY0197092.1 Smr/MutS family protein [Tenuifilaceae bacterium]